MKRLWMFLIASSVALSACVDAERGDVDPQPQASGWSFDDGEHTSSIDCDDAIEPRWFRPSNRPWYYPNHFGFSPNSGLLRQSDAMMGNSLAHRISDGETFFDVGGYTSLAIDAGWTLVARPQAFTTRNLDIMDRRSAEVVASVELEDDQSTAIAASFGPQAQTLGVLTCRQAKTSLIVWSVTEDREVLRVEVDPEGSCGNWTRTAPQIAYVPDGRAIVLLARESGHLIHVDLDSGQMRSIVAHRTQESDVQMLPPQGGLDLAVHPSGRFVATSGVEGEVRFWRLPTLEPAGTPLAAGVAAVNLYAYATPHRVSPLAWTPDGSLLAMMDERGRVVLREPFGEVVSTLSMPQVDPVMPEETTPWVDNPPMAIAFDEHGRIAVGSYASVGLWECGPTESTRAEEPLEVSIDFDGPHTLRTGQAGVFSAGINGAESPVVTRLLIDGEVFGGGNPSSTWTWHATEPGVYHVRLEVDDGRRLTAREMVVEVTQAQE